MVVAYSSPTRKRNNNNNNNNNMRNLGHEKNSQHVLIKSDI